MVPLIAEPPSPPRAASPGGGLSSSAGPTSATGGRQTGCHVAAKRLSKLSALTSVDHVQRCVVFVGQLSRLCRAFAEYLPTYFVVASAPSDKTDSAAAALLSSEEGRPMDIISRSVDPLHGTLVDVDFPPLTHAALLLGSLCATAFALILSRCCWPVVTAGMLIKRLYRAVTHSTPHSAPHYAAVAYAAPASRPALLSVCLPGTSTVATSDYLLHGPGLAVSDPRPRVFVVNIVGNPGIAAFYRTFALKLWASLSGSANSISVLTLGHANHCADAVSADLSDACVATSVPGRASSPADAARDPHADAPPPPARGSSALQSCWWALKTMCNEALKTSGLLTSTCRVFSLEEQVQHKVAVLTQLQALHPGCIFVLTGHSIGAWIALEVMKRSRPIRDSTVKVVGMFPTLHHIGSSPNGVRLYPLFVYGRTIAATLLDAVSWAPRWAQRAIAGFALDNQRSRMTNEAVSSLLGLFDGRVAHNFLFMAKEEMEQVRSAAASAVALREHQHKMEFYVGEQDPWNAADGNEADGLRRLFPQAAVHSCTEGHSHSFVLDEISALNMASKVASWAAAPVQTAVASGSGGSPHKAAKAPAGMQPLSPLSEAASAAEVDTAVSEGAEDGNTPAAGVQLSVGDKEDAHCSKDTQPGPGVAPEMHAAEGTSAAAVITEVDDADDVIAAATESAVPTQAAASGSSNGGGGKKKRRKGRRSGQ